MTRVSCVAFLALSVSGSACSMLGGGMPAPGVSPSGAPGGGAYSTSPAVADTLRRQEKQAFAVSNAAADTEEAQLEKKVQHALKLAFGQEGMTAAMPPPDASSAIIVALRGASMQLRIEPMTNMEGAAVADNLVVLKDSFTDRVVSLQKKVTEGRATPAEMKEIQAGAKYLGRLNDLKMQVSAISMVAMQSNVRVQIGGLTDMRMIASMVQSRKQRGLDWTDDDWGQVQAILARQRRTQALAASTIGMLAAYEAVVGQGGDPKALDAIAHGTLDSFPLDAAASVDEAKAYVQNLAGNAADQKAKYESWMRSTYGDDKYEKQYKANIDRIFDSAGQAGQTKTNAQMGAPAGGSAPRGGLAGRAGQVEAGVQAAKAIAAGDFQGTLDAASNMFPGDGPIQNSLKGISAITHGDVKGAFAAAISLAPGGGLMKAGLGMASQLLKLF